MDDTAETPTNKPKIRLNQYSRKCRTHV